ncbi:MAG: tRNA 2-thiouridine(34) synthase MnmA [Muribaculaceae bacterium]|jgi:tRNA (5-methylaminomethyl-2-thiouridylate)-methyltransferase|uniref:tRNA-specific 2-thiouridylase MnmA n=1 Tax=uncultured bacterium BAC25G1 TaxID=1329523 RepID=R4JIF8_9BACT|nr:tRNA (5-methylaminomethyl-2-thiouridylate)-methyltransferase [uncultured bacterium BAC25G1]
MKIAVLISGGVDSAVVVHKLFQEGHDLHLFYIRIGMDNDEGDCSAEEDIEMCTLIAHKYGLPLKIVSLHKEYWDHVMAYTLDTVAKGLTPHPDMMCNKLIKFGFFEQRWGKDFDKTATGHYASIKEKDGTLFLATAKDPVKDQTDFLAQISYDQLSHLMFPLGDLDKAEVREIAREANLPNASRKDSQGICFLGKIDYADFIARHLGEKPGPLIDIATGKKIGEHKGYWFYTIGQRKGLGMSGGPWFVVKKNIRDNVVYVSNGYDTKLQYGRRIPLEEINWISGIPSSLNAEGECSFDITFKTRHTPEFLSGKIIKDSEGIRIISESDVQGIAPGQFAIIYSPDKTLCLGSGMISANIPKRKTSSGRNKVSATPNQSSTSTI